MKPICDSFNLPCRIDSIISLLTKLRRHIAMPQRIAPAWPELPPPATLATTSHFPSISANINGNSI